MQLEPNLKKYVFLKRFISQMQPPNSVVQERLMSPVCRHLADALGEKTDALNQMGAQITSHLQSYKSLANSPISRYTHPAY